VVVLAPLAIFAVTFAVQEHNDRVLSEEITGTASELQYTGQCASSGLEQVTENTGDTLEIER
jgi:hypothetical protein